jgi:hypothetical protein
LLERVRRDPDLHVTDDSPRVLDREIILSQVQPVGANEARDICSIVDDEWNPCVGARGPDTLGDFEE